MERRASLVPAIAMLVLLFLATEMGTMVEARICESQSHRFKGLCVRHSNCANVCRTEGFPGGECRGFRRRCFCVKTC
ncbi:defensin Ec-AMP-D1-like [Tasmannia lanceolata]|uniref:defensin Ec-AMP-D1-like n=1 Tax=Tasmannia lanceolata TaxID=3420 RepID=UPI004063A3F8